jgi:hypothetical protein
VISRDPVDGTSIGTTLTGVDTPGDINAGDEWMWVDDTSALYRIDPTTLEMVAVAYGRTSPQQRPITLSSDGPWLRDPDSGDIVRVDAETRDLAFEWLFPDDVEYVNDLVAGGGALWANTAQEEILKLDPGTGAVIARVNTDVDTFNPLIFEDGSLWTTAWRDGANPSYVVVRFDAALQVVAEIELPNVGPGFYWNDQMVSGDGYIFLTGYTLECECPDTWNPDDPISRVVRIDPSTNTITSRPIEGVSDYAEDLDLGFGPFLDLAYGNGWLWGVRLVEDWDTRDIVRIDPNTLEMVGGPITTELLPWAIEVAFDRLWISHINDGVITTINMADLN